MIPVVSSEEMARAENWAVEHGCDRKAFMQNAGQKVALRAKEWLEKRKGKNVTLLVGKGNKGGDAYVTGIELQKLGFKVRAVALTNDCSELNQHFAKKFISDEFEEEDLIIDGILGTGFHGQVDGVFAEAIQKANNSKRPIIAIDIPSGLNGTTGEVGSVVIRANVTVTLGFPKMGLFLKEGWNYVGKLYIEDFGLPEIEVKANYVIPSQLSLPPMQRNQHKYERGLVVGFGGSNALKGAIKLSGRAALHSGAGIVKIFSLEEIGPVEDELIAQIWNQKSWEESLKKAKALMIGPGLGRKPRVKKWLAQHLPKITLPCVIDADALFFPQSKWPENSILTPHRGEMLHLLNEKSLEEEELLKQCQEFVNSKKVVLVLKGAPTFIFGPSQLPMIIPKGDSGMATAGSGDVLTGIIAALLAQGMSPIDAAILGVTIHALTGEAAAGQMTSYGYSAGDLIHFLPNALLNF